MNVRHPVDGLEGNGLDCLLLAHSGVVDQDVDSTERGLGVSEQTPRGLHVAEVASPGKCARGPVRRGRRAPATGRVPAHKVTRANDSKALTALLRNFFAKDAWCSPRSVAPDPTRTGGRPARFASGLNKAENGQNERSFRFAQRNVSQGMAQVIEIIMDDESVISINRLFSMTYLRFRFAVFAAALFRASRGPSRALGRACGRGPKPVGRPASFRTPFGPAPSRTLRRRQALRSARRRSVPGHPDSRRTCDPRSRAPRGRLRPG